MIRVANWQTPERVLGKKFAQGRASFDQSMNMKGRSRETDKNIKGLSVYSREVESSGDGKQKKNNQQTGFIEIC